MNSKAAWLAHPDRFYIGGKWIAPSGASRIDVVAPATEEIYARVGDAAEEDINRAVAAARTAFEEGPWPRTTALERAAFVKAIASAIIAREEAFSTIWPNEMGITQSLARIYTRGVASHFDLHARLAESFRFEEEHVTQSGAKVGLLVREPVGVVGAIIPWNGPLVSIVTKLAPALIAGCTVVLKAAPEAPCQALLIAEIAEEIGLPAGVLNVVIADREVSESLVRHRDIDKISFTGSSAAGKRIASLLGARVKRYTLELGGKSAAVILDDFDVGLAAEAIAGSTCAMTGQVCAALTRIVVSERRHDDLLQALRASFSTVRVGDPFDPETQMGPLATRRQRERVERYIASGKDDGFTLACGGNRPRHLDRGFFVEPTVFGNVDNKSVIAQEEIFGPVISVIPAASEEQAVAIANDSEFGLNGSVFTNDIDRAYSVSRRLRTGTVGHNAFRLDFGIAFGGFKESGVGREGGVEGLYPYLEAKTLLLDAMPTHRST